MAQGGPGILAVGGDRTYLVSFYHIFGKI
jgi:hypothetical protein